MYSALDADGQQIALKVVSAKFASADVLARFEREAGIRIDHPNVVRTLGAGSTDTGEHYIALELLRGEPLNKALQRAPLPVKAVVDLGRQVCDGLTAAHARGFVHRDLKPGNVFICDDGTIKLLDFGIARSLEPDPKAQLTMEGSVIGTPGYLAPEQARGERGADPRSDLWALGVILYQALTGVQPFLRDTQVATILAVVLEQPQPLAALAPQAPGPLVDAISRCLQKAAADRWASAADLGAALQRVDLTSPAPVVAASIPVHSKMPEEKRVVALVLASGVHNLAGLEATVSDWGGELIPMLGGRAIGVFGGQAWEGDEAQRAVSAAVAARQTARWVAVASGRASGAGGAVSGDAVRAVERACATQRQGVAVDAQAARSLAGVPLEQVSDGVFEVDPNTELRHSLGSIPVSTLPLLGREAETAQLDTVVSAIVDEGRSSLILVTGPPGIGKSRIRWELERRLANTDVRVVLAGAESHRRGSSMHLLANAVRSTLSYTTAAGMREALYTLTRELIDDPAWAEESAESITALLGLSHETAPTISRVSDPQLMFDKLRVALSDFFSMMAERGPTALIFDDLQWADEDSLAVLRDLAERSRDAPLLMFLAARPELLDREEDLLPLADAIRIQPRGLSKKHVAAVAAAIAGRPVDATLIDTVSHRTGGNPMFVEQIFRELAEQRLLDTSIDELPIPLDVEASVQSRLDHLPREEKELCKVAAVFGDAFSAPGLAALGVEGADVLLGRLSRRGLTSRRGGRSRSHYQFQTQLIADVAYRMIPDNVRGELHRSAAQHLAKQDGAEAEAVAHHYEEGGEVAEAAKFYVRAALRASRRGDNQSALRCSEKALTLGAEEQLFDLHMVRADALSFLGRRAEQQKELHSAFAHAEHAAEKARVLTEQVGLHAATGAHDAGLYDGARAVKVARECGDPDVLAFALARYGWVLLYSGHLQKAEEAIGEATELSPQTRPATAAVVASWRAQLAAAQGDPSARRDAFEEAIRLCREAGDLRRTAQAESNLADTFNRVGLYAEAEEALRASLQLSRRVGNRSAEGYALANLGYALTRLGRTDEAIVTFDEATAIADEISQPRLKIALRVYRARALLHVWAPEEVVREAEAAADDARRADMPAVCVNALSVAARAWLQKGDAEMALSLGRRAMQLHDEIGALEEDEIDVFLTHVRVLLANGDRDEAHAVLAKGKARLKELADKITDPEWRRRFLEDVKEHRELLEL